jgi:hypothetical protein
VRHPAKENEAMDNLRNRSLGELLSDLGQDVALLVRKEIELARVEIGHIVGTVARRASFIAVGAALGVAGLLALVATAILGGIAMGLSPVVSSAIVTVALLAVGGLLVSSGMAALRKESLLPTETIQTLKDTSQIFRVRAGEVVR